MVDEELHGFVRSTLKSMELRIGFLDAQLNAIKVHLKEELDVRVELYYSSIEKTLVPLAQAVPISPEVENIIGSSEEQVRIMKPMEKPFVDLADSDVMLNLIEVD
uniref:Uncharacterized protein n=1 Tax=Cannabis sativa TaxID=3483 RepID=A0A803PTR7_CANSA